MIYKALDIAKYVVSVCYEQGAPVTNLKLQKILYFIQKDFIKRNTLAFSDDIEAWKFGPVVPSVYYHFCHFGSMPITEEYKTNIFPDEVENKNAIDHVIQDNYKIYPWTLVERTHKPNGAWAKTFKMGEGCFNIIKPTLIKQEA